MIKNEYNEEIGTVEELIAILEKIEDKNIPVVLEGCDCYGSWSGNLEVEQSEHNTYGSNQYLLLKRNY